MEGSRYAVNVSILGRSRATEAVAVLPRPVEATDPLFALAEHVNHFF